MSETFKVTIQRKIDLLKSVMLIIEDTIATAEEQCPEVLDELHYFHRKADKELELLRNKK
jgi:hypothetical protein